MPYRCRMMLKTSRLIWVKLSPELKARIEEEAKGFAFFNYVSTHNVEADFDDIETWSEYARVCYHSIVGYMSGKDICWPYGTPTLAIEWHKAEEENKRLNKVLSSAIETSEKTIEKLGQSEQLLHKMAKDIELIQKWCKEAGIKAVAIDNPVHMAIYQSLHQSNKALSDYNTYKQGNE